MIVYCENHIHTNKCSIISVESRHVLSTTLQRVDRILFKWRRHITLKGRMTVNYEQQTMWKKVVMPYF